MVEIGADDPDEPRTIPPDVVSPYFKSLVIDDTPALLSDSYRLRYQVYCLERGFLEPGQYPDDMETDAFDAHAVHIGVVNTADELVATARLVQPSAAGLPLFGHCVVTSDRDTFSDPSLRVVEVSRLAVSRRYNRRRGDSFYGLQGRRETIDGVERRRAGGQVVLVLYRELYQVSKRRGFTHWLAATERSLQRLVAGYRFPFRQIGPEIDYFGMVAPYLMDLAEFDRVILSRQVPLLGDFLTGLEPGLRPVDGETAADGAR